MLTILDMSDDKIDAPPTACTHVLHRETVVPLPLAEVFDFFSRPANLDALTPPWLRFTIERAPAAMGRGAEIAYRLRLRGLPIRWTSVISAWEPPGRFVDEQVRGPYRRWRHEHRFEAVPGGTRVVDHVEYAVPGGRLLHGLVNRLFVARDVAAIFDYRQQRLRELLRPGARAATAEPAA